MNMAKLKQMNVQEYNRLLDFIILDWGKPADEQGKLAFSFYIASNVIQPNLQMLKDSDDVMTILAKMGLTMNWHHLLETEEKRIGFFLGKSPDRTWRGGLENRFHQYLARAMTSSNIDKFRETYPKFPNWIPFSIRTAQIPGKTNSTPASNHVVRWQERCQTSRTDPTAISIQYRNSFLDNKAQGSNAVCKANGSTRDNNPE
jgi:hypothetical protein